MTSANEVRRSGISVVGDRPWGTHFCNFYESRKDLLDMLLSYFKAGLEDNEFCVWVVSEPLSEREAWDGLREAVPEFDYYLSKRSIEVFDGQTWYLKGGISIQTESCLRGMRNSIEGWTGGMRDLEAQETPLGCRRRTGRLFRNTNSWSMTA